MDLRTAIETVDSMDFDDNRFDGLTVDEEDAIELMLHLCSRLQPFGEVIGLLTEDD